MSEEDEGKGCFWILAGVALCFVALCAGLAILELANPS